MWLMANLLLNLEIDKLQKKLKKAQFKVAQSLSWLKEAQLDVA
jgi:hypothetical protein